MNVRNLDFSNGNNAALSLRVLAEKVRTGDCKVNAEKTADGWTIIVIGHQEGKNQ